MSDVSPELGLWMSLSDLARARQITKAPLSRRIARLEAQDLITTRSGPGGTKLINVAEFDRVTGETTDAIREANGRRASGRSPGAPVLAREQARKTAYQADLAKLELDERLGNLLTVKDAEAAVGSVSEVIVREIDRLPSFAEDVAAAIAKDGVLGARILLKRLVYDIRSAIVVAIEEFASAEALARPGRLDTDTADA